MNCLKAIAIVNRINHDAATTSTNYFMAHVNTLTCVKDIINDGYSPGFIGPSYQKSMMVTERPVFKSLVQNDFKKYYNKGAGYCVMVITQFAHIHKACGGACFNNIKIACFTNIKILAKAYEKKQHINLSSTSTMQATIPMMVMNEDPNSLKMHQIWSKNKELSCFTEQKQINSAQIINLRCEGDFVLYLLLPDC